MKLTTKKNSTTDFFKDIKYGKTGEQIFQEDFLKFLRINFINVTGVQAFQVIDSDFVTTIGRYEIKLNYKDDKQIIIEEYTNIEKKFGAISFGWFYKTKADLLVFISKKTNVMILLPFTDDFKNHYEQIKSEYELRKNRVSVNRQTESKWQSAFRRIPLSSMSGFFSYYKRINT